MKKFVFGRHFSQLFGKNSSISAVIWAKDEIFFDKNFQKFIKSFMLHLWCFKLFICFFLSLRDRVRHSAENPCQTPPLRGGVLFFFADVMKVSVNFKKIIGKELDDQAERPVKYYLVMTTFTCGRENFLELDGRSFERPLSRI